MDLGSKVVPVMIAGSVGMGDTAAKVTPPVVVLVATKGWQMGVNEPEMGSVGKPGIARGLKALVCSTKLGLEGL